jgi:hypothetical protein
MDNKSIESLKCDLPSRIGYLITSLGFFALPVVKYRSSTTPKVMLVSSLYRFLKTVDSVEPLSIVRHEIIASQWPRVHNYDDYRGHQGFCETLRVFILIYPEVGWWTYGWETWKVDFSQSVHIKVSTVWFPPKYTVVVNTLLSLTFKSTTSMSTGTPLCTEVHHDITYPDITNNFHS